MPDYVKGIINLRGKIIPVIDVRMRNLGKSPLNIRTGLCIIVMI